MADFSVGGADPSLELRPASFLGELDEPAAPERHLWRRVCLSVCEADGLAEDVIAATHSSASFNATVAGVSGVFLFSHPIVLLVTEYDPNDVVAGRFCCITLRNGIVLSDAPCTHRLFPGLSVRALRPQVDPGLHFLLQRMAAVLTALQHIPQQVTQVLREGRDPLQEPWRVMDVTVAFVKLAGYDRLMQHPVAAQHIGLLADRLVSACTAVAKARGGFVMKTIHGMCMLYWPVGNANQTLAAICQCVEDLDAYRQGQLCHAPGSLLYAFAGVHYGPAVLANVGGRLCDYTLLGDTVNVAARLSSLAIEERAAVLVSSAVRQQLSPQTARLLVDAGRHTVKGRSEAVQCFRAMDSSANFAALVGAMDCVAPPCPQPPHRLDSTRPSTPQEEDFLGPEEELGAVADPAWQVSGLGSAAWQAEAEEELFSITFVSHAACPSFRYTLPALRRSAARANQHRGITAGLLYVDGLILQTIEGPRPAVFALWGRIRADPRHRDVVAVRMVKCTSRTARRAFDVLAIAEQDRGLARVLMGQLVLTGWALDRYVPTCQRRLVLQGMDLRRIPPVTADTVLLATDLCGYTTLCEASALSEVARMCKEYLELCVAAITEQGGEVLKIIGDAVLARFGATAPECAVAAAQTIVVRCCALRKRCSEAGTDTVKQFAVSRDCRTLATCGVGLDYGPVTLAYSGCAGLTEMILLGTTSTRVMEVERMTRETGRAILLTSALVDLLPPATCPLVSMSHTHDVGGLQLCGLVGAKWDLPINHLSQQQALFSRERHLSEPSVGRDTEVFRALTDVALVRPALFYNEQVEALGKRSNMPDDDSVAELTGIKAHPAERMGPQAPVLTPAPQHFPAATFHAIAALCKRGSPRRAFEETRPAQKRAAPRSLWCCLWPRGAFQ